MKRLGFAERWVKLVMTCIILMSYSVVVNGNPMELIRPSRGIRLGDPLCPYLFLLCAESLNALLQGPKIRGVITGVPMSPRGLRLNHLFFANDSLFFYEEIGEVSDDLHHNYVLFDCSEWKSNGTYSTL
jgi:hypothetical protein